MAAFGREAGPSASSGAGKAFSIFPSPQTSTTQGGFLPQSRSFGVPHNTHPASHPSPFRASWIPDANACQSSPPPSYNSISGHMRSSDHSMEFVSKNFVPGGTRSPVDQPHYVHPPLRNSRAGLTPQRRGESPYVWIKGQTPPVEKKNSGIHEANMKTHIIPATKTEQLLSTLNQNTIQRPLTSPQKSQGISLGGEMHAFGDSKKPFPMNQEIPGSKHEQKDYSRATLNETAQETSTPSCSNNSVNTAVNDSSSIRTSGNQVTKKTRSLRVIESYEALPGNIKFNEKDSNDRESQAKAKRLARFKQELNLDYVVGSHPTLKLITKEQKSKGEGMQLIPEEQTSMVEGDILMNEVGDKLKIITGLCPHMCPESERGERERKGDLDQYERVDGDRNLSSMSLAVKKYTRTAEREPLLIRPMPVLQKTMEYLLRLLDLPYDEKFLGLYNFLWDRMRAIRMDLRMQHLFNLEAVYMLEQMIRLHIVAMHELCEYSKGEGFSEGFDAHLNIEQMNKTSVELFQMYDDHKNKGIPISTEQEFRGYYALLKLDKHPGYKVDPGELSLDLSKMTQMTRQTPEVRFARDVARACRTGNFTAFFRLARKASYLQACLMHAHFAKLRTVALAAIHSGLQMNQGLPVSHVAQWLVMEDEDIESLLDYHGFAIKEFEESYMVKEGKFLNSDKDFPTKCSKLVHLKKSGKIMKDIVDYDHSRVAPSAENCQTSSPLISTTQTEHFLPPSINLERKTVPVMDEQMTEFDQTDEKMKFVLPQFSNSPASQQSSGVHKVKANGVSPWKNSISSSSPKPKIILKDPTLNHLPDNLAVVPVNSPRCLSRSNSDNKKVLPFSKMHAEIPFAQMPRVAIETNDVEEIPTISGNASDFEEPQMIINEEGVRTNFLEETADDDEVSTVKMKLIIRKWKRRASQLKMRRKRKLILSEAALDVLTVGPSFHHFNESKKLRTMEKFDIDKIVSERLAKYQESWSRINISDEIGDILWEKNPHSDHLFWKLLLFFPTDEDSYADVNHWLRHKLMPSTSEVGNENAVYSSSSLSIWKKWSPNQNGCCVSFVRCANPDEVTETFTGASGIMFPLSESFSLISQKCLLNDLIASLPSNASLPLVILASKSFPGMDMEYFEIDRTRISSIQLVHVLESEGGFLSNARLRGALRWLASHAPSQPELVRVELRRLVLCHLDELLNQHNGDLHPGSCISTFNKALELAVENVVQSGECNKHGWPCPETRFLEGDVACHVSPGWSSPSRIEELVMGLRSYCLPSVEWVNEGLDSYSAIQNMKAKLRSDFVEYMVSICGIPSNIAGMEADIIVQKCTDLCLKGGLYYLIPNWKVIFKRILKWRVMGMSAEGYLLRDVYEEILVKVKKCAENAVFQFEKPTLDEMIDVSVGCVLFNKCHYSAQEERSINYTVEEETSVLQEKRNAEVKENIIEENPSFEERIQKITQRACDRFDKLVEKCHRLLDANERKLRIYF